MHAEYRRSGGRWSHRSTIRTRPVDSLGGVLGRLVANNGLRRTLAKSARRKMETRQYWGRNGKRIVAIAEGIYGDYQA